MSARLAAIPTDSSGVQYRQDRAEKLVCIFRFDFSRRAPARVLVS
jgi:hypothetical protein